MLNSAEIKRQILMSSDNTGIRKRLLERPDGISEDEIIEMGNALESITKQKGWNYIEAYIMNQMDIVGLVFSDDKNDAKRGGAQKLIMLMQWMDQHIKAKDDILRKRQVKEEIKETEEA